MCPICTDRQNASDRLVADTDKVLHSRLTCSGLREVAQGRVLGYCGICWLQGLGPASNIPAAEKDDENDDGEGIEYLVESTPTPSDEAASDPPSVDLGRAGG
jgi:hypothetical protein